jgi:hypothetical protein
LVVGACGLAACGSSDPAPAPQGGQGASTSAPAANHDDGISLSTSSPQRITGRYADLTGDTIQFDLARVDDDLYVDVTGNAGRPILHIETSGSDYNFSYMGGALTMHTTKEFVAAARTQAQTQPAAVSTAGFAFTGDLDALTEMQALPEVSQFPALSRALGARGYTGSDFPASLAFHKVAQQAAQSLNIHVGQLAPVPGANGYCDAYPNQNNDCYGMCGPGCDCWSWVCGDCCYHYGCAVHDSWCRDGEWWYCYNITAVIALFGC